MQTDRALKVAATRAGLGANEYLDRVNKGLKYCNRCLDWHPYGAFGTLRSAADGLRGSCRASRRQVGNQTLPTARP